MNLKQAKKQAKAAGVSRKNVVRAESLCRLSVGYLLTKWQEQPKNRALLELGICYRYEYLDDRAKGIDELF